MLKQIAIAFCAVALLSGCSTGKKPAHTVASNTSYLSEFERNAGDRVFFGYDSAALTSEAKEVLMRQADWLKKNKMFSLTVEGHADERGTREYNIALGEKRADAVRKFLAHNGVENNRMEVISYGKERPAVIGNNEAAWKLNRRSVTAIK